MSPGLTGLCQGVTLPRSIPGNGARCTFALDLPQGHPLVDPARHLIPSSGLVIGPGWAVEHSPHGPTRRIAGRLAKTRR